MDMKNVTADQIIAQEIARSQQTRIPSSDEEINEAELYAKLTAPFGKEAYSTDSSRGFNLTSIKAQFVVERLNESLGLMNWSHGGEYEDLDTGVLFKGALVITVNGKQNRFFAVGYSTNKKNVGDAYKGAKTDALCKAASQIGVGNDAFKGLIDPNTFEKVVKINSAPTPPPSNFERKSNTTKTTATLATKDTTTKLKSKGL